MTTPMISLLALVKNNDGLFKTVKQKDFFVKISGGMGVYEETLTHCNYNFVYECFMDESGVTKITKQSMRTNKIEVFWTKENKYNNTPVKPLSAKRLAAIQKERRSGMEYVVREYPNFILYCQEEIVKATQKINDIVDLMDHPSVNEVVKEIFLLEIEKLEKTIQDEKRRIGDLENEIKEAKEFLSA